MNDRAFLCSKQNAMNYFTLKLVIRVLILIIEWLIKKRREYVNQNRNAVTNAVAKN